MRGKSLPAPRRLTAVKARSLLEGLVAVDIGVAPDVAAKLALLEALAASGCSKSELASRLGKDEKEVRRMLDPMHATKLPTLAAALTALGRRLVIGVEDAEAA